MIQSIGDSCVGCSACFSVCPVQCIKMIENPSGFMMPVVDEDKCIKCKKCLDVCPAFQFSRKQTIRKSICGWHQDSEKRETSSSGGAFTAVASRILSRGGIVFGAAFDRKGQTVRHMSTDEVSLDTLQRSKYVQSDLSDCLLRIKEELEKGREVLFCGTPCQVNGLNNFIEKRLRDNLTTCDFSCHGVPSRKVFLDFLKNLEKRSGSRIKGINFRSKVAGWKRSTICVTFDDGTTHSSFNSATPYYRAFLDNYSLAPCCYPCEHNANHSSDLVLADYWWWEDFDVSLADDDRGLSLVLSNSPKGDRLIAEIEPFFVSHNVPLELSMYCLGTLGKTREKYRSRHDAFFSLYRKKGYHAAIKKYVKTGRVSMFLRKLKRVYHLGCWTWIKGKLRRRSA